ncbi:MAG: hypothetical protein L0387_34635, partial [Acidobacteria bacterium]|nr:hypothetical protein [Acidobacteriota bacterium]
AVSGSPGGWPILPISSWKGELLQYPVGVGDIDKLAGRSLVLDKFREVSMFIFMGENDKNDSVSYNDGYKPQDRKVIYENFGKTSIGRWGIAEQVYQSVQANCRFRLYPNEGHKFSAKMRRDVENFFTEVLLELKNKR